MREYLRRSTFEWQGVDRDGAEITITITVREETGEDVILRDIIAYALPEDTHYYLVTRFADFVLRTESVEGMPWVTSSSTDDELRAAFEAWRTLTPGLMQRWRNELAVVNQPPIASDPNPETRQSDG